MDDSAVFFLSSQKIISPESCIALFSPEKLERLFLLEEFEPSPDRKMIKLVTFDNLFPPP